MNKREKSWRKNCFPFRWMCKALCFFPAVFVLLSCHTLFKKKSFIPGDLSGYQTGFFSGSLQVYHKGRKNHFNGDIFLSEKGRLRMDLSVFPGGTAFSLLMDTKELIFLSLRKKEFYRGPPGSAVPPLFFAKKLSLSVLREIFFDRAPSGGKWRCKRDEKNLSLKCQKKTRVIQWGRGGGGFLSFRDFDFGFTFYYFSFSSEVEKEVFSIEIPKNFKALSRSG